MNKTSEAYEEICAGSGIFPHENIQLDDPFINNEARRVLEIIFCATLTCVVSSLGSVANVVNIIIFFKQGFNDSINISLCGLAVSDLGSLLPLVWKSICYNPLLRYSDRGFDYIQVQYLLAGWPRACFLRIMSWITACITFERCVCIALPLKVKNIITPRRTLITVVVIFVVIIASVVPAFCIYSLGLEYNVQRNRTLISTLCSRDISYGFILLSITVIEQLVPFFLVIVFTTILITNMKARSGWRQKAASFPDIPDCVSSRDKKVIKMVIFISSIFIACLLPSTLNFVLMTHFPTEYNLETRYENTYEITWTICNTLEAFNSSISLIVYYRMSSRYRATFITVFKIHAGVVKKI